MDANLEQLYNTYYMRVYSFVMTLAKNQHDAEEITQKTFFKAMISEKKYRGDSSELTWLCAIAKNLYADECRARKRTHGQTEGHAGNLAQEPEKCEPAEVPAESVENALINADTAFRIHQVLHELEEPYKEVFQLRVFGELPFCKIGLLFGKTENWARVTHHRARLKIQERMEES